MMDAGSPEQDTSRGDVAEDYSFSGRVTDFITGNPISGARVTLPTHSFDEEIFTDSDGRYTLDLNNEGPYTLMFSQEGWHTETITVRVNAVQRNLILDMQLLGLRVTGRVTDALFPNRTLSGIEVSIAGSLLEPQYTNSRGQFVFEGSDIPPSREPTRRFEVLFSDPEGLYEPHVVSGVLLGPNEGGSKNPDVHTGLSCQSSDTNTCGGCGIELDGLPGAICSERECFERSRPLWLCDEIGGVVCFCTPIECELGEVLCGGQCIPNEATCVCEDSGAEICDGIDNDCNGDIDGLLLATSTCPLVSGAVAIGCEMAECTYKCEPGLADFDGDLADGPAGNGCECFEGGPTPEVCDGLDNDCDSDIDEEDREPLDCEYQQGVCVGAQTLSCSNGVRLECTEQDYSIASDATFEGIGVLELMCDGEDGNCNGDIDENCCGPNDPWFIQPFNFANPAPVLAVNPEEESIFIAWFDSGMIHYQIFEHFERLPVGCATPPCPVPLSSYSDPLLFDAVWDGLGFGLAWANDVNRTFYWTRYDREGSVINNTTPLLLYPQEDRRLLSMKLISLGQDGRFALLWSVLAPCVGEGCERLATMSRSYIRLFSSSGLAETEPIELSQNNSDAPGALGVEASLHPSGGGLVVWHDVRLSDSPELQWRVLGEDLRPVGVVQSIVVDSPALFIQHVVAVPDGFLIVHEEGSQLQYLRVNPDGSIQAFGSLSEATNTTSRYPKLVDLPSGLGLVLHDDEQQQLVFKRLSDSFSAFEGAPAVLAPFYPGYRDVAVHSLAIGGVLAVVDSEGRQLSVARINTLGAFMCFE